MGNQNDASLAQFFKSFPYRGIQLQMCFPCPVECMESRIDKAKQLLM